MRIDIMTLFPDAIEAMMGQSIIGRAQARGHVQDLAVRIPCATPAHEKSPIAGARSHKWRRRRDSNPRTP